MEARRGLARRTGVLLVFLLASLPAGCGDAEEPAATGPEPTRLLLGVADAEMFDQCPPITLAGLRRARIAFSGTLDVLPRDSDNWLFTVDHWYTGGSEDEVLLEAGDASSAYFGMTVRTGEEGDRFVVAGYGRTQRKEFSSDNEGNASACLTARWTERLDARFDRAFPTSRPRPFADTPPRFPD